MAYDSLKALIRQYIKTNGEQEITGQILQNVLVEMVNQYPSTDGYATQSWVTSQGYLIPGSRISLLGNDVGYLTSADLSGYATISQLAGYLPLTGGTLTGDLNMAAYKLYFGTSYIYQSTIPGPQGSQGHILNFLGVDGYGYYGFDNSVHATSFVKSGGTSAQFLKADGSVDSNTYLIPGSSISLLGNDVGYLTSADLSGYATTSQLAGYLPLTGGTLTGDLNMAAYKLIFGTPYIYGSTIPGPQGTNMGHILNFAGVDGYGYYSFDNSVHATSFIMSGGTSAQFLKADGSVDSTAYITLASVKGNLSAWNNTAMTWGTLTAANGYTIGVHASSSDGGDCGMCYKGGQISMQLDGWYYQNEGRYRVVDTSDLASYNPTTNFKTINNQSIIGTGNINIEGGGGSLYDAEIEYLESSGVQIIDCDINPAGASSVSFNGIAGYSQSNGRSFIAGDGNYNVSHYCEFYNNKFGAYQAYINVQLSSNTMYNVSMTINGTTSTNYGIDVSGTSYSFTMTMYQGAINNKFYLFAINPEHKSASGLRIGKCKIYINNTLVRDFIPVRVGNVGYLYDKVSGQLFGNSGTGSFVLGPDKEYLPLTGGTISGNLTINSGSDGTSLYIYGERSNGYGRMYVDGDGFNFSCRYGVLYFDSDSYFSKNIDVDGRMGVGTSASQTYQLIVGGQVGATGFVNTSDLRKKTIIGDVPINLYNVANAPLFKFTWNNETKYSGQHIGSAAQYWQTVLPELVSIGRDADMTLAMQYDVIALASAITVAKTVVNHEERIILLERENEALRQEIADLKSA